jgi:dolichyl-phosphate-mannose--protein O-mannosyl transferase
MSGMVEGMMSRDSDKTDWIVGGLLFVAMLAMVFFRIDHPPAHIVGDPKLDYVFDEAHYVPAAKKLIGFKGHTNTEHPLFAKETIAAGILLFGDNPFGWRVFGALLMSCAVPAIFGMCRLLGLARPASILAAVLLMLDQTSFVLARTAMLDPHSIGWFALFLVSLAWSAQPRRSLAWAIAGLAAAGVLLGFAAAAKWMSGINGVLVWIGITIWRLATDDRYSHFGERIYAPFRYAWPRMPTLVATAISGFAALVAYLAVFWPVFFLKEGGVHDLAGFFKVQLTIYERSALPLAHHPYQSLWWEWPLQFQPIWFYFRDTGAGSVEAVFYVGNFVVYWGGLIAVAACLVRGAARIDKALLAIAFAYLGFWLIWAVIPKKIGFLYYYAPASLMLGPAIAAALDRMAPERYRSNVMCAVAGLALINFAWFYPGLTGLAAPKDFWPKWTIAPNWVTGHPDPSPVSTLPLGSTS